MNVRGNGTSGAARPAINHVDDQVDFRRDDAQMNQQRVFSTEHYPIPARPIRPWIVGCLPPLQRLEFLAWFYESSSGRSSSIRRTLLLTYDADSGQFSAQIQGNDNLYVLSHITDHRGSPLSYLDLHVGCKLNCLGRPTTIMQAANLATSNWIDQEAAWLQRLTRELSTQLMKYGHIHTPGASVAATPVSFRTAPAPGSTHLRHSMGVVEGLYLDLEAMRPKAAAAWAESRMRIGQKRFDDLEATEGRKLGSTRSIISNGGSSAFVQRVETSPQRIQTRSDSLNLAGAVTE